MSIPYEYRPHNDDAKANIQIEKNVGLASAIVAGKFYGRQSRFVICPDHHVSFRGLPLLAYWDILMLLLLGFVSFVTPFEVAFVDEAGPELFSVNLFTDACFSVDMTLQFFLMYRDEGSGHWVSRHSQIVKHYIKGWFVIDALSIFPFVVVGNAAAESMGSDGTYVNKLRGFKALKLLRALKLVRLLKLSRLAQRWSAEVVIPHLVVTIAQFATILVLSSHWIACVLGMAMAMQEDPSRPPTMKRELERKHPTLQEGEELPTQSVYIACLYWAIMTLSSIGYGDIVPVNDFERGLVSVVMLLGSCLWAFVVGTICGECANISEEASQFRDLRDQLNAIIKTRNVERDLRIRLRQYFNNTRGLRAERNYDTAYDCLSPQLQGELILAANRVWLEKVPWLAWTSREFVTVLVRGFSVRAYAQKEIFGEPMNLYVLQRGVVAVNARVYVTGDIWGEDQVLLFSPALLSLFQPCYSLTFSQVQQLHRSTIEEACLRYPGCAVPIRHAYVRMVFRSAIRFIASKCKSMDFDIDQKMSDQKLKPEDRRHSVRRGSMDILTPIEEIIAIVQGINEEDKGDEGYGIIEKGEEVDLQEAHRQNTSRFAELDAKLDARFRQLEGLVEETLANVRKPGVGTEAAIKFKPSNQTAFRPIAAVGETQPSIRSGRSKSRDSGGVCINGCSMLDEP
jgi:hypothetical protein